MNRPAAVAKFALCVALLSGATGCADSTESLPVFEEQQSADNVVSSEVVQAADLDPETTRLLGSSEGVDYFAARSRTTDEICLLVYRGEEDWGASCAESMPIVMGLGSLEARLSPFRGEGDGWTTVGEYVSYRNP